MLRSDQVLTVAQMRAAEASLIAANDTVASLMQRAGAGAADWVRRIAGGRPVTILCGPGNNGGDGFVIARHLRNDGLRVAVVTAVDPVTEDAKRARAAFDVPIIEPCGGVLVDCLFGSGLSRPLSSSLLAQLRELSQQHETRVALDVPSGIDSNTGAALNDGLPQFDVTLALGAWKPAHALMPAMALVGECRLVPIGLDHVPSAARLMRRPQLSAPAADAHKYTRGLVVVVEGPMTGAALLAAQGAMRAGAGAVRLWTKRLHPALPPDVVLGGKPLPDTLADKRIGAVLAGPGLGLDDGARAYLAAVLAAGLPTVIDADGLRLIDPAAIARFDAALVLTPHAGEMDALAKTFAIKAGDKVARTVSLARATGGVVAFKGPDTVIAAPDGRVVFAPSATSWLSVGGSGDVLAGIAAARLAATHDPFTAACEAVWLHSEAGRLAGPAFLASDIASNVPAALAECL